MDEKYLLIELDVGTVKIEMLPDVAPKHVERITALARDGAYDGIGFHRVIEGFMAQTGDVKFGKVADDGSVSASAGTGGSDLGNVPAEFSSLPFDRGVCGMARAQDVNSANSQFFIMFEEGHFLNNNYTVWGRVVEGMREYFHVCNIGRHRMIAMPSQAVDVAWHEFILFTREYKKFCDKALGRFLHHTPAEAMASQTEAQKGIQRAWKISCAREGIAPRAPNKLPLLFALDVELGVEELHGGEDSVVAATGAPADVLIGGPVAALGGIEGHVGHQAVLSPERMAADGLPLAFFPASGFATLPAVRCAADGARGTIVSRLGVSGEPALLACCFCFPPTMG